MPRSHVVLTHRVRGTAAEGPGPPEREDQNHPADVRIQCNPCIPLLSPAQHDMSSAKAVRPLKDRGLA